MELLLSDRHIVVPIVVVDNSKCTTWCVLVPQKGVHPFRKGDHLQLEAMQSNNREPKLFKYAYASLRDSKELCWGRMVVANRGHGHRHWVANRRVWTTTRRCGINSRFRRWMFLFAAGFSWIFLLWARPKGNHQTQSNFFPSQITLLIMRVECRSKFLH